MTLGSFLADGASSPAELTLDRELLSSDIYGLALGVGDGFDDVGTTDFVLEADGDTIGVAFFAFVLSRSVRSLRGTGTVVRDVDPVACVAASSKGVKIARVRSSQGSTDPAAGRDGRPPRRFLVAVSSLSRLSTLHHVSSIVVSGGMSTRPDRCAIAPLMRARSLYPPSRTLISLPEAYLSARAHASFAKR
jgi:hypothetical protein